MAPSAASSAQAPRCNLPIAVAKISATIPAIGDTPEKPIEEEAFVIRDEMGIWNKKQMMSSKAVEKSH